MIDHTKEKLSKRHGCLVYLVVAQDVDEKNPETIIGVFSTSEYAWQEAERFEPHGDVYTYILDRAKH